MSVGNFDALPPDLRFFAGGDRSIRGFDYHEIGEVNANGLIIGGQYLAVASAEYEYYFNEDWGAAVFVDAGDAFTNSFQRERRRGRRTCAGARRSGRSASTSGFPCTRICRWRRAGACTCSWGRTYEGAAQEDRVVERRRVAAARRRGSSPCVSWVLFTTSGARWVAALATSRFAPMVKYASIDGTIAGELIVTDFRFEGDPTVAKVRIARMTVDPTLRMLFSRVLRIERATVEGLVADAAGAGETRRAG